MKHFMKSLRYRALHLIMALVMALSLTFGGTLTSYAETLPEVSDKIPIQDDLVPKIGAGDEEDEPDAGDEEPGESGDEEPGDEQGAGDEADEPEEDRTPDRPMIDKKVKEFDPLELRPEIEMASEEPSSDGVSPSNVMVVASDVAQIGNTTYTSIEAAFSALESGDTLKLLNDCEVQCTSDNYLAVTCDATIDLNGHSLTGTPKDSNKASDQTYAYAFIVENAAAVTVKGSGTVSSDAICAICVSSGTLTLSDGVTVKNSSDIHGAVCACNGSLKVESGATVENENSEGPGIRTETQGNKEIEVDIYGTVTGGSSALGFVWMLNSNTITINTYDGASLESTSGAVIDLTNQAADYNYGNFAADINITIGGGDFIGASDNGLVTGDEDFTGTLLVKGGNFSESVDWKYIDDSLNAELYSKEVCKDAPYSYYTALSDALSAAADAGDTSPSISLKNSDYPTYTVTIDLDGGSADDCEKITLSGVSATGLYTILSGITPTKEGYDFNGWTDSAGNAVGSGYLLTGDTTVKASWQESTAKEYVAKIGETPYETLEAAFAAASTGDTITLLSDCEISSGISVTTNITLTLDLAGFSVTSNGAYNVFEVSGSLTVTDTSESQTGTISSSAQQQNVFKVASTGTLTLSAGTYMLTDTDNTDETWAIIDNAGTVTVSADASLKTDGGRYCGIKLEDGSSTFVYGTIDTYGYGIIAYADSEGAAEYSSDLYVYEGADISSSNYSAISYGHGGEVHVSGGSITSYSGAGISISGGELAITDGEICGTNFGLYVTGNVDYPGTVSVTIDGGTIQDTSTDKSAVYIYSHNDATVIINDGKFVGAEGSEAVTMQTGCTGSLTVNGGNFSASVDPSYLSEELNAELYSTEVGHQTAPYSYYTSFTEAIAAAVAAGDTSPAISIPSGKNIGTTYKVTLYTDGGTIEGLSGDSVTLSVSPEDFYEILSELTPEKKHYTFDGWKDDDGNIVTESSTLSDDTKLTASWTEMPDVASVGGVNYKTLEEAIEAASDGDTITLLSDCDLTEPVTIEGKTVTLDLGGFTLGYENEDQDSAAFVITVLNGGDLTIENGTFSVENQNGQSTWAIRVGGGGTVTVAEDATVESQDVTGIFVGVSNSATTPEAETGTAVLNVYGEVSGCGYGIAGNGYNITVPTEINVYEPAYITATKNTDGEAVGIYEPQDGTINVYGGTIEADVGVGMKSGTINVYGGEIIGTGDYSNPSTNNNGMNCTGSAIEIESYSSGYTGNVTVNIYGGTLTSENSYTIYEFDDSGTAGTVDAINVYSGTLISGSGYANIYTEEKATEKTTVYGGNFSESVDKTYLDSSLTSELYSTAVSKDAPYSYYSSSSDAIAAALEAGGSGAIVTPVVNEDRSTYKKVTLDTAGGSLAVGALEIESGQAITSSVLNNLKPKKSGYTFMGWSIDGSSVYDGTLPVTDNMTLTALWKKNASSSSSSGSGSGGGGGGGSAYTGTIGSSVGPGAGSGWVTGDDGSLYYYEAGAKKTGWFYDPEKNLWYYLDLVTGAAHLGWWDDPQDHHRYYLDPVTGQMYVGYHTIDGVRYYFNDVLAPPTWYLSGSTWVYDSATTTVPYGALIK